jgi:hypothetical protein
MTIIMTVTVEAGRALCFEFMMCLPVQPASAVLAELPPVTSEWLQGSTQAHPVPWLPWQCVPALTKLLQKFLVKLP